MEGKSRKNDHEYAEPWLHGAEHGIRPLFAQNGYPLPKTIHYAIAFTSHGWKGKMKGQVLFPDATGGDHKIILMCNLDDPVKIVGTLIHELGHVVTGHEHGQAYRDFCLRIGMDISGGLRNAMPGPILQERVNALVESLGPLPHKGVDFEKIKVRGRVADAPAPQKARMRKAECTAAFGAGVCGYTFRIARSWAKDVGAHCPRHGAMTVHWQPEDLEGGITIDGQAVEVPKNTPPLLDAAE